MKTDQQPQQANRAYRYPTKSTYSLTYYEIIAVFTKTLIMKIYRGI